MARSARGYAPLVPGDEFEDEKSALQPRDDEEASEDSSCRWCRGNPAQDRTITLTTTKLFLCGIILLGVFLLGCAVALILSAGDSQRAQLYDTDFAPAREAVELEQVRFTGSPLFDEDGEPYFKGESIYSGTPTMAKDLAWDELIKNRYFVISDDEAREAWGPDYQQYYKWEGTDTARGGYVAGLDVLHTLHCVNMLRQALYKDHYHEHNRSSAKFQQYHVDHCLDIVRQTVQCKGDLTLIPTRWWNKVGNVSRDFIDSDQVHTCRNFQNIREWASERYKLDYKVERKDHPVANLGIHPKAVNSSLFTI